MLALAHEVAGRLQVHDVLQLERHVVHLLVLAADEVEGVVIRVAADEDEEIADPVRHPEAEHPRIEIVRSPARR